MYKILITLSVELLASGLSNGWPFAATKPWVRSQMSCAVVVGLATNDCNRAVVEGYMKTPLIKKITKMATMNKPCDKDRLAVLLKKAGCCIGTDVIMCIEKSISAKCTKKDAKVYNSYMEKSKDTLVKNRCSGSLPSHEECTEH